MFKYPSPVINKIDIAEIGTFNSNVLIGIRDAKKDADTVTGAIFGLGCTLFQQLWIYA